MFCLFLFYNLSRFSHICSWFFPFFWLRFVFISHRFLGRQLGAECFKTREMCVEHFLKLAEWRKTQIDELQVIFNWSKKKKTFNNGTPNDMTGRKIHVNHFMCISFKFRSFSYLCVYFLFCFVLFIHVLWVRTVVYKCVFFFKTLKERSFLYLSVHVRSCKMNEHFFLSIFSYILN